jgi:ferredoxin
MKINSAKLIYFSPTQTTQKVLEGIARGFQVDTVEHLDVTPPAARTQEYDAMRTELAIMGAPVYGGRIPIDAEHRLRRLRGHNTPAIIVVVYGNRAYEDALLELKDLAVEGGFVPVAAGAFIGEHSFSTPATPIADGRPDAQDSQKTVAFGRLIQEKLGDIRALDEIPPLQVPGDYPYRERGKPSRIAPVTREELCGKCGTCATGCPTAAITVGATVSTDQLKCILCCACVKNCPTGARVMEHERIKQSAEWLYANYSERREPELFVW